MSLTLSLTISLTYFLSFKVAGAFTRDEMKHGFQRVQNVRDLFHVCILTVIESTRNYYVPHTICIYFIVDCLFHPAVFRSNLVYALHHVFAMLMLVYTILNRESLPYEVLTRQLCILEASLVPICFVHILPAGRRRAFCVLLRPIWYAGARLHSISAVASAMTVTPTQLLLSIPLLAHNTHVLWRQTTALVREIRSCEPTEFATPAGSEAPPPR